MFFECFADIKIFPWADFCMYPRVRGATLLLYNFGLPRLKDQTPARRDFQSWSVQKGNILVFLVRNFAGSPACPPAEFHTSCSASVSPVATYSALFRKASRCISLSCRALSYAVISVAKQLRQMIGLARSRTGYS